MKLSQGDTVQIISGKDKGKRGTVMRVLSADNRVIVSGANMVTKHVRKTAENPGKKITFERSLSASNVMIIDPKSGKPTRVGYQFDAKTGAKIRFAKGSKTPIGRVKVEAQKPKDAPASVNATEAKDIKTAAKNAPTAPAKKSPFWKKLGFGSDAMGGADGGQKVDSGPAQSTPTHTRSAGRGS